MKMIVSHESSEKNLLFRTLPQSPHDAAQQRRAYEPALNFASEKYQPKHYTHGRLRIRKTNTHLSHWKNLLKEHLIGVSAHLKWLQKHPYHLRDRRPSEAIHDTVHTLLDETPPRSEHHSPKFHDPTVCRVSCVEAHANRYRVNVQRLPLERGQRPLED